MEFHHRKVIEVVKDLFARPDNKKDIKLKFEYCYNDFNERTFGTTDFWRTAQLYGNDKAGDELGTAVPIILFSDEKHLYSFSNAKLWPIYCTTPMSPHPPKTPMELTPLFRLPATLSLKMESLIEQYSLLQLAPRRTRR
jgi:hypothetical protein